MRGGGGSGALDMPNAGSDAISATAQVKAAVAAAGAVKRPSRGRQFMFDRVTPREAAVAPLLGIYLGFAVGRLHERFPVFQVPYLLWGLMAIMLATIAVALPDGGWKRTWQASPQLRLVGVLTVLAVVTVPLGIWMSGALSFLINRFTIALAVYVACLLLLRDSKVMRRIVALYVVIVTVVAFANVLGYFTHDLSLMMLTPDEKLAYLTTGVVDAELMRQSFGSLDPNDIAAVMATTMPLALWLAVGNVRRRMLWTPCAIILVLAVIPTASRGGLLGLGVAAAVLVLVGAKGGKRIFLIASLVVGGIAFYALAGSQLDRMSDFATNDYNYTNSEGRIAIWKRGVVWMIRRPWGYGLDNFPTYFGWLNGPSRAAHNSFLQYGVELGVLGLAAYLLICWTLVRSLLNIRQNALRSGPAGQDTVVLCGHVLAMLAACWTTGFFLSHAYYPLTYMAIGIGSAVVLSAKGSAVVAAPAAPAKATAAGERRRRQLKAFDAA
jgi:O-antigen ligase